MIDEYNCVEEFGEHVDKKWNLNVSKPMREASIWVVS